MLLEPSPSRSYVLLYLLVAYHNLVFFFLIAAKFYSCSVLIVKHIWFSIFSRFLMCFTRCVHIYRCLYVLYQWGIYAPALIGTSLWPRAFFFFFARTWFGILHPLARLYSVSQNKLVYHFAHSAKQTNYTIFLTKAVYDSVKVIEDSIHNNLNHLGTH
jgi:hypothetical protein